jgi:Double zinc ribbon
MQCPQCQAENPDRARFCEDCGARLELKCPHCGDAATPGKKFCASCGGSLVAAPSVAGPAPSPQDYTPQHLAEGFILVRALGPMQVRGLGEPIEVHEVTGAGSSRSRLQATAARGLTRFVGRDAELETLRRALEQAAAGHGQIVALVGEPGMRPLVAHCHLGLGALYQRIRRHEQAQSELAAATTMYGSMEMDFWLAKAEAVLAQVAR